MVNIHVHLKREKEKSWGEQSRAKGRLGSGRVKWGRAGDGCDTKQIAHLTDNSISSGCRGVLCVTHDCDMCAYALCSRQHKKLVQFKTYA